MSTTHGRSLASELVRVKDLTRTMRDQMFALYSQYYEATSEDIFHDDLNNKHYVFLLTDASLAICGFSTIRVDDNNYKRQTIRVLFSGDTIVDRRYWGQQQLAFHWIRFAGRLKASEPTRPLYWLLIVKGHRTYRYLPAFSRHFYPNWTEPTPRPITELRNYLARERFGNDFDEINGIVRFPRSRGHLQATWAAISDSERRRPAVSYFLERNPGYASGDELVCLCELNVDNLRPLAQRLFRDGMTA